MLISISLLSENIIAIENYTEGALTEEEINIVNELSEIDPNFDPYEGEIISVSKTVLVETPETYNENGASTYGVIGDNYMDLYVTVSRINSSGFDKFKIYSYFKWKKQPYFKGTDALAIAWSDDFTLLSSSMNLYYTTEHSDFTKGLNKSISNPSAVSPEAGIGYSFDLFNAFPTAFLQSGNLSAYVHKHDSTGTANVVTKYVHTKLNVGISSFSFSKGSRPSISISVMGASDDRTAYNSFYY